MNCSVSKWLFHWESRGYHSLIYKMLSMTLLQMNFCLVLFFLATQLWPRSALTSTLSSSHCLQVTSPVLQMSSPVPAGVAFHATLCATVRTNVATAQMSWSVLHPPVAPVNSSVETRPVSHAAGCATTMLTARQEATHWSDAHTHTLKNRLQVVYTNG